MKNPLCAKFALAAAFAAFGAGLFAAQPIDARGNDFLRTRLCPVPKECKFFNEYYALRQNAPVKIAAAKKLEKADAARLAQILKSYFGFEVNLEDSAKPENASLGNEGYAITIGSEGISIDAVDFGAARQALKTIRQMAETERDGKDWVFAHCKIKDFASLKFRGIHICMFPETTMANLQKFVRLAAYYKFNYIVLEPWGTFPFKSHPEFSFPGETKDRAQMKKLIELCRELGITPIPQFSVLGHASQARLFSGKHAVLTHAPELADIYEPLGWSYCMSSERGEKILKELIAELHEFFGNPPFFHLGCDEAFEKATCYKCRQHNPSALFVKHLKKFSEFLKGRGARAIIWHDMLLDEKDPRWKNEVATGDAVMAEALKTLSRDIIIADWQYSYRDKKQTFFPTPIHFKNAGFDVIVCPWEVKSGVYALAKTAQENNLFGYMETTWHHLSKTSGFDTMFYHAANAAWNGAAAKMPPQQQYLLQRSCVMRHIIDVENDAKITKYGDLGRGRLQINIDSD